MGWIIAALMTAVAVVAIGLLWWRNHRRVRRLRSSHQKAVRRLDGEHQNRLDRIAREHDRELQSAHHPLAQDLFPAIDSLDEALVHLEDGDQQISDLDLEEGLTLARNALYGALKRHDITDVSPQVGDPFDPEVHEAISRSEDPNMEPGTICQRFRRGYRDDNRVLRPALVEVNVAPSQPSDGFDDDPDSESDELSGDDVEFLESDDAGRDEDGALDSDSDSDSGEDSDAGSASPSTADKR